MAINLRTSPYNDRFDPRKDRVKLLFNPDRPLQQAELNEMQQAALRHLESVFEPPTMNGDKKNEMFEDAEEEEEEGHQHN